MNKLSIIIASCLDFLLNCVALASGLFAIGLPKLPKETEVRSVTCTGLGSDNHGKITFRLHLSNR